jgi:CheY-like chemotaxis protein
MPASIGLVVDDDASVRRLFSEVLQRGGIRVLEAVSGRDALRLARSSPPDFVVTDLEMADMDGLELCRQLRRSPATTLVPIVLVTGAGAAQAGDATAAGCDVVLLKPCPPALLLATIRRLLVRQSAATARP